DGGLSAVGVLHQPGVAQWHTLEVAQSGVLAAEAFGTAGLRLTLARADETVLATSEDLFAGRLDLHLAAGTYRLGVSADAPDVAYQLSAHVTEAASPIDPLVTGAEPQAVA